MTELFLSELVHIIVSLSVGLLLYWVYRKRQLVFLALAVGVLIDLDHLIDYLLFVDFSRFDLIEFLQVRFFQESGKVYILFHGWEYAVILSFLAYKLKQCRPILVTIGLAMFAHLLIDQLSLAAASGGQMIAGYSFIFRLAHNFDAWAFSYFIF